ncbi:tetratricopeptide repeat protein [Endozoicomonas sp.]|uniref:tetratricopeptide repeat protein n=1 Tax=Endozoicomonas sp. TaxID=1892382 RepID=UPI00288384B6|nr:hypothetical protein [Endozoicomonas sp.]
MHTVDYLQSTVPGGSEKKAASEKAASGGVVRQISGRCETEWVTPHNGVASSVIAVRDVGKSDPVRNLSRSAGTVSESPEESYYSSGQNRVLYGSVNQAAEMPIVANSDNYKKSLNKVRQQIINFIKYYNGEPIDQHGKRKFAVLILYKHLLDGIVEGVASRKNTKVEETIDELLSHCKKRKSFDDLFSIWKLSGKSKLGWYSCARSVKTNDIDGLIEKLLPAIEELEEKNKSIISPYCKILSNKGFGVFSDELLKDDSIYISIRSVVVARNKVDEIIRDYQLLKSQKRNVRKVLLYEKLISDTKATFIDDLDYFLSHFYLVFSLDDISVSGSLAHNSQLFDHEVQYDLSPLECRMLVAYQLYREDECGLVDVKTFEIIELYNKQLKEDLANHLINNNDFRMVSVFLIKNLSRYISNKNNQMTAYDVFGKGVSKRRGRQAPVTKANSLSDRPLDMLMSMIDNEQHCLVDFIGMGLVGGAFLQNYKKGNRNHHKILNKIGDAMLASAKQDNDIHVANYNAICISEINEDSADFDNKIKDSSKYSLVALLILIANNLGLSKWPFETINPDQAVEYLSFLVGSKSELDLIRPIMEGHYEASIFVGGRTQFSKVWAARSALYFFLVGEVSKGDELLKCCEIDKPNLYLALAMIAKNQYEAAIRILESDSKCSSIKLLDARIKALLAVLHEKLADSTVQGDENAQRLENSITYLKKVVSSRPELQKNLARVLGKKGEDEQALKAWLKYKGFLEKSVQKGSMQRATAFTYATEIILVNEKIDFLQNRIESSSDKPSVPTDELFLDGNTKLKGTIQGSKKNGSQSSVATPLKTFENASELSILVEDTLSGTSARGFPVKYSAGFKKTGCVDSDSESGSFPLGQAESELVYSKEVPYLDNDGADTDGDDQSPWRVVNKKGRPHHEYSTKVKNSSIPHILSDEVVDEYMMKTSMIRFDLNDRFLNLGLGYREDDFHNLMIFIDQQIQSCENPVVQSHFIQNKEWLLRMKVFDNGMMIIESRNTGYPVIELKVKASLEILEITEKQIANLYGRLLGVKLPDGWFSEPDKLKTEHFIALINHAPLRFRVQLGAQFSMAAHVMEDFYDWHNLEGYSADLMDRLCGMRPKRFHEQSKKFYYFRNFVNPEHNSDII